MRNCIAVRLLIGLGLVAALVGSAHRASAQKRALATIPFSFEVNHQVLPPGDYEVDVLTPRMISFVDSSTGTYKALLLVHPEQERRIETHGCLTFLHADKRYFLTEIRFEGSSLHAAVIVQPSLQRELARQTSPSKSTVEIATR